MPSGLETTRRSKRISKPIQNERRWLGFNAEPPGDIQSSQNIFNNTEFSTATVYLCLNSSNSSGFSFFTFTGPLFLLQYASKRFALFRCFLFRLEDVSKDVIEVPVNPFCDNLTAPYYLIRSHMYKNMQTTLRTYHIPV